MPKGLYDQAKTQAQKYHYNSVSELIRDALRWWMSDNLTVNGFTPEFEEEVLKAEKEADKGKVVEWDGKTPFTEFVLSHPPKGYGKNQIRRKILSKVRRISNPKSKSSGKSRSIYPMV